MGTFLLILLLLVGMFMILVVMLQRGRGGGLVGALGGQGGHSAFGTRAGDLFTWITIGTACVWVLLACGAGWRLRYENERYSGRPGTTTAPLPGAESKDNAPPPIPDKEKPPVDAKGAPKKTAPGTTLPAEKPDADATPKSAPAAKPATPAKKPAEATEADPKAPASESPSTEKPATETPDTETPAEPAKPE